jgi:hypothetical protein
MLVKSVGKAGGGPFGRGVGAEDGEPDKLGCGDGVNDILGLRVKVMVIVFDVVVVYLDVIEDDCV